MANRNSSTFVEIIQRTCELRELFKRLESPEWCVETLAVELMAEVGTLADSIMIAGQRRKPRRGSAAPDLGDDIADVLFVLLVLAAECNVDVEAAYLEMIEATRKKLSAGANDAE